MRVVVDPRKCQLHGDCVVTTPEVFRIDDDATSSIVQMPEPPETLRTRVQQAVRNCPAGAIRIES